MYFDFSGYADMAIGSGLFFGIRLPENFNSPYKALDIQDFWRRWHMTLSNWLKNYIYIPLGGSRCSLPRTCVNLFLTFFLGGVWHGAGWTFIIWGLWHQTNRHFNKFLAWLVTFNFINITWIFFRANSVHDACSIIKKMFNWSWIVEVRSETTLGMLKNLINGPLFSGNQCFKLLLLNIGILLFVCVLKNSKQMMGKLWQEKPSSKKVFILSGIFWFIMHFLMDSSDKIEFLYWQF